VGVAIGPWRPAERGVELRILVPGSHIDKEFVRTAGRAS
jgi:hypothetical protein